MIISQILISLIFIAVVVFILLDKYNRAVITLVAAVLCYFILVFIEGNTFGDFVTFLFGSQEDDYVNLQSLILILGMSIIVNICNSAGVFNYLAFKLVQMVANKPKRLLPILCLIAFLLSMILNNILTVMILIPLTITISRMLNFDPEPYILTQAILVNIGGTVFSISSIPNILITLSADINFNDFFINVGLYSIFVFIFVTGFFFMQYKDELTVSEKNINILMDFEPGNFIQSKKLFNQSISVLLGVMICFILIPSNILPSFIISFTGAVILIILSKVDQDTIIQKIDTELFLYLMGIFVLAGAFEEVGIIQIMGKAFVNMSAGSDLGTILLILWISAILSSIIDNIPITKVLIPVVDIMGANSSIGKMAYYSLAFGANWGDNLTPMGDNILVMDLAKKNKRPISMKKFFKLGFTTTIIQLYLVSILYSFMFNIAIGIFLLIGFIIIVFIWVYKNSEKFFGKKMDAKKSIDNTKKKIDNAIGNIKNIKIKKSKDNKLEHESLPDENQKNEILIDDIEEIEEDKKNDIIIDDIEEDKKNVVK